jgi:hypothetical protein
MYTLLHFPHTPVVDVTLTMPQNPSFTWLGRSVRRYACKPWRVSPGRRVDGASDVPLQRDLERITSVFCLHVRQRLRTV